ncbi:TniQ family protein [Streptosporangium sp. CA-135522]|uniref:TniQ family protein n=1 Tax=Streptosporangium sp. CA-135522 TaxID=3240072 RepID=UPI003D914485
MITPPLFVSWKAPPLHRLPRRLAPVLDETLDSYLTRLAAADHLDPGALRERVSGSRRKSVPVPADRLARLIGNPERSLRYAILELCTSDELQSMHLNKRPLPGEAHRCRAGCRSCLARLGFGAYGLGVVRWHHFEDVICWRHQRWMALNFDIEAPQPDVARLSGVLR